MQTPSHSQHGGLRRPLLVILTLALAFALAHSLQTQEVEIGSGGAYDGTVKITRDPQGRMLFSDGQVTVPVPLNDLRYAGRDHGLLLGLADDDHPHYHNDARHAEAHSAPFNGALATPADLGGNATLGAHLGDTNFHLDRRGSVSIEGAWSFAPLTQFLAGLNLAGGTLSIGGTPTLTAARAAALTQADVDNLRLDGNTLASTNANGNILLSPAGNGRVTVMGANSGLILRETDDNNDALRFTATAAGGTFDALASGSIFFHYNYFSDFYAVLGSGKYFGFGTATPKSDMHLVGDFSASGGLCTGGNATTKGTLRLDAAGAAALTQADIDNLRLDGNTLASTNANGDLNLAPAGTGTVVVAGDLAVGSGAARLTLNGQRFLNEVNLLDNPDFNLWQRNTSLVCASGGNAAGTLTWPVPATLSLGADRWQVSRAKTDMVGIIGRATPPAGLATARYCLKTEYSAGATCNQYIHQTLPRELTAGLRGKWVTFAVSHYLNGNGGGAIGLYKVVGGTPAALNVYAFTSTANTWERIAVAVQVPADAEVLMVGVTSNLAPGGPTLAWLANATLVEGKFAGTTEKVSDPALSCLPPLPRRPADDLANCQGYFEKGAIATTFHIPDTAINYYTASVQFNTAKAATPALVLSDISTAPLTGVTTVAQERPAWVPGETFPQGFQLTIGGTASQDGPFTFSAAWTASCPEPI